MAKGEGVTCGHPSRRFGPAGLAPQDEGRRHGQSLFVAMPVWPTIERFITEHGSAVLVTLAEAQGSSPREVGARMVVRPDGAFSGTIGGGALEWIALAEAQAMMAA